MSAPVLILTRRDIAALMTPADYLEAVEAAFLAQRRGRAAAPPPMEFHGEGGAFHAKAATLTDAAGIAAALKLNGNFPGNPARGLPTIQGAILYCDGATGALLAVMDSIEITLRRTAAASALAARHLAREDAGTLLVVGCGEQARPQAEALAAVRSFKRGFVFDRDAEKAAAFAAAMARALGIPFEPARELRAAARASDVIVTATPATRAYLSLGDVSPGAFIAAVGADSPAKNEIAPELMAKANVVADIAAQCAAMGDLRAAIAAGAMAAGDIYGELGDLVAGEKPGRRTAEEIFIFDSTGSGLQDVASARVVHQRAVAAGAGRRVELGAA